MNIFFQGKEWKCYVCDNTLLKPLRAECRKVLDHIEAENQKVKEKAKTPTNATPKSSNPKESNDSKKAAAEKQQDNKPKEGKQLLKVLTSSNPSSRSSSPSEFQKAIVTKPHAGTTINTEKVVIDPKTGNTTKFEMVYPNANIVQTQYKPPLRPAIGSTTTESGLSLSFTGLLPGNIHSIISNLLSMTDNLQELLKNIQENVIPESNLDKLPFEISLRSLSKEQLQARLTAANLVKSGVNLFLQEMAMKTSAAGVKAMNLSQQGSQPKMTSLLAGKPLDRNGGAMTIDTPQKFDKPGGANSPLVTSTPKPKSAEDDSEVLVLSSSPEKSVSQKSDICSESQDDGDDTMVNENEIAEKELLKDAAEELGSEDDDSDSQNNVSTGKTERKGKGKLVVKLVDISNSTEKDQEKASSVTSTTNEDSDNSRKRTRNKTRDEANEKDKECKPVRKTRSQSQDNDSDSDQSQSRSQGSDRVAQKGNKSNTTSQNDKKASKTNSKGKSESKGKPKESDDMEEDSSEKEGKSSKNFADKKIEKAAKKLEKNENIKTSVNTKSADDDSSHSTEDSDDPKEEIDDETDTTEDEDFEESKSRRSSKRKSGTLPKVNIVCCPFVTLFMNLIE